MPSIGHRKLSPLWAMVMTLGAAFYTVVVGSLTSVIIDSNSVDEELNRKLKALEMFAVQSNLDYELHQNIR
jgi:hypothetical protein